ncbi:MAG: flagellar motor protein MotB [Flavobacteriaceae bacterium]|nr:flagellar motor protein MotB [Flavobacteriaceae bacterium]
MKKVFLLALATAFVFTACVSKKKYLALESDLQNTRSELQKTTVEKEELEAKFAKIEARVAEYNAKINSLRETNDAQLQQVGNTVVSNKLKENMRKTLAKVDRNELAKAQTLEDSVNLAVSYNIKQSISSNTEDEDVQIDIDKTVVMITISDKLLFKSGSYRVSDKADGLLQKLAEVINSEPSMEVMVEGHTDAQTVKPGSYVKDNWDLSVERSTAIIRTLQEKFGVNPSQLIAAGRGSFHPIAGNETDEDRAKNRRTRIVIIPDLDKFFSML